ncbi:EpsG family protein [Flagellimonas sp. HMM57]|uniref:EpsG family protein n=1 Tax=unclassified Flagellimonas TaxID=2644544 RepID=UPI0013D726D8|nr:MULTISPECIES: EpsG family protein [unclassified Flagellimonas]UII76125.1 EpsG family protein [Flagellimonas sp. HMM57]
MFDFIPIEQYSEFYVNIILLACGITYFHTLVLKPTDVKVFHFNRFFGILLLLFVLLYIGTRPIHGEFVDMMTYAQTFEQIRLGLLEIGKGDAGFEYFMLLCTQITNVEGFFFISACIYVIPLFIASKNWFPQYYLFAFLVLIASFSFWTYGVNGIRNGMATSLFVLALSYQEKNKIVMIVFFFLSFMFHKSMMLPLAAFGVTFFLKDTQKYYFFWVLGILLSISMGGVWISLFTSLGFGDDRLAGYLSGTADPSKFSSTGFRFDFLLYSAAPLALAFHYIFKKGFNDPFYKQILHTYIVANAFWIMIIRANFSNRFAYLSWFLMGIVVIYPILKTQIWPQHFKKVGIVVVLYYAFTFFMHYYYQYRG